nr:immunoglobulin heavy chain junction region [Mus musculus]MBK4197173.1 immunoglobulin heavy chain junction region [Mus musculus]MBK4197174.1 immunoglobulin heavy chain junction region [Mus musculus]MBK4197175.1 immunoglobulin heavy chain junction region [Mus musculus]MBK4197176.1 immunoglobulin heavy chain junction region [Mus musculus]
CARWGGNYWYFDVW